MCINVAGKDSKEADRILRRELTHARIEIVESAEPEPHPEVHTHVTGKLGDWTFRRNWYYWVADGRMPIEMAGELWADPLGKDDVRVGGHCGCPSPDEYGTDYFDADGKRLYSDPDGSQARDIEHLKAKGLWSGDDSFRLVPDRKAAAVSAFVTVYHVDSEAGLRLLADYIRRIPSEVEADIYQKEGP